MREIPLTNGGVAVVDKSDHALLSRFNWWRNDKGYACAWISGRSVLMHRLVFGAVPPGRRAIVDHKNRDRLDNRRSNLRLATRALNVLNKPGNPKAASEFKGVSRNCGKWRCRIMTGGRSIDLGHFDTEEEAALAYDEAARRLFGEFAFLNIPNTDSSGTGASE